MEFNIRVKIFKIYKCLTFYCQDNYDPTEVKIKIFTVFKYLHQEIFITTIHCNFKTQNLTYSIINLPTCRLHLKLETKHLL